jgi:hypothetical protein
MVAIAERDAQAQQVTANYNGSTTQPGTLITIKH